MKTILLTMMLLPLTKSFAQFKEWVEGAHYYR